MREFHCIWKWKLLAKTILFFFQKLPYEHSVKLLQEQISQKGAQLVPIGLHINYRITCPPNSTKISSTKNSITWMISISHISNTYRVFFRFTQFIYRKNVFSFSMMLHSNRYGWNHLEKASSSRKHMKIDRIIQQHYFIYFMSSRILGCPQWTRVLVLVYVVWNHSEQLMWFYTCWLG